MITNIDNVSAILAIFGICIGAVSIIYAMEVAKRNHQALEQHRQDTVLYISQRLSRQDKDVKEALEHVKGKMDDLEAAGRTQVEQMKTMSQELRASLVSLNIAHDTGMSSIRESIVMLERARQLHESQLSDVKFAVGSMVGQSGSSKTY